VVNPWRGHGQVDVTIRLRDTATGRHVMGDDQHIELEAHDTVFVSAEVMAPSGQYAPEVEVVYPPR
jgi:hypothetical protein